MLELQRIRLGQTERVKTNFGVLRLPWRAIISPGYFAVARKRVLAALEDKDSLRSYMSPVARYRMHATYQPELAVRSCVFVVG